MANILAKKALLVSLKISLWGAKTQDNEATNEVLDKHQAAKDSGQFVKQLLSKDTMGQIQSVNGLARTYHRLHTLPWLSNGSRILPLALYQEYATKMKELESNFDSAVDAFIQQYPRYVKEAAAKLGGLYNPGDYPSAKSLMSSYTFNCYIHPIPDKDDFRVSLAADEMKTLKRDLEENMQKQMKTAMKNVGERVLAVVGNMADRLKNYKPANREKGIGAQNTFRTSLVRNVEELARLMEAFNMADNKVIAKLQADIHNKLCQFDYDTLKEDSNARKQVSKSAFEILAQVKEYLG